MNILEPKSYKQSSMISNYINSTNCTYYNNSNHLQNIIGLFKSNLVTNIKCSILHHYTVPINIYPNGLIYDILNTNRDNISISYCKSIDKFGLDNNTNLIYSKYHSQINNMLVGNNFDDDSPFRFHSKLYDIHFVPIKIILLHFII